MQLYTKEELLKRAWIADSVQADIMIEAIAASYNGDVNTFHCLMNKVANLHWLSQRIKCVDPSVGETRTELSNETVSQVSSITLGSYNDFTYYEFTVIQTNLDGEQVILSVNYTSSPPDTMETVVNELINQLNTTGEDFNLGDFDPNDLSVNPVLGLTASTGTLTNEIVLTANTSTPIFIVQTGSPTQVLTTTPGSSVTKYTTSVNYADRCLTDEQIQAIVLNIELLAGAPCGCDPNIFLTDTIPNIITFTSPIFASVIPFAPPGGGGGGGGGNQRDFNTPDFNSKDYR